MTDMARASLRNELAGMLMDSAERFSDPADFDRQLDAAVRDLPRVRPRVLAGELTLVADQSGYTAPADLLRPLSLDWGKDYKRGRNPWEDDWPGACPRLSMIRDASGRLLYLSPAPTEAQINLIGASAAYRYSARYTIGDLAAATTVLEDDADLLLVRALAEAMRDLASRGVAKPVTLGSKAGIATPRNGHPAELAKQLVDLWERMAR